MMKRSSTEGRGEERRGNGMTKKKGRVKRGKRE